MLGVMRVGLSLSLLCSIVACVPGRRDAALIRVDRVEQALERSDELLLRGDGFPPGMRGEAQLRGTLYPVGRPPVAIELRAPCRALGAQKARVELDALPGQLAGEGPFEGSVEVRFGSHDDAQLVGRSEGALFRLGATPHIEEQFAASQRAQHFQRAIGIEALEQSEAGLRVSEIARGSAAAKAGLMQQDVVLRMDGRPIQLGRDLVRLADESELSLEVRGARDPGTRIVRVASRAGDERPLVALTALALLLGVGLGAVLATALPGHLLWAPRRREYWLLSCCALCCVWLGALIVRDLDPLLPRMCKALLFGAVSAGSIVYLRRRLNPTLRTERDPYLAPLL
jgi:hypothetical protein